MALFGASGLLGALRGRQGRSEGVRGAQRASGAPEFLRPLNGAPPGGAGVAGARVTPLAVTQDEDVVVLGSCVSKIAG